MSVWCARILSVMPIVLLLRHGRSTSNAAGTLAGRTLGIHLDDTGRSQAMAAGERLRGCRLDLAVSSPMERCQETLDLALDSAALDVPRLVDDQVTECDYGQWSGRELSELVNEPLWQQVQQTPSRVTFPDGESMQQMARRMVDAVTVTNARVAEEVTAKASSEAGEGVWMLVSHGDPIKAVLSHALGQSLDDFQRIVVDPASVSIVRWPARGDQVPPMVLAMNTTAGALTSRLGGQDPQLGGGLGSQG